jgi:hypothetical protein
MSGRCGTRTHDLSRVKAIGRKVTTCGNPRIMPLNWDFPSPHLTEIYPDLPECCVTFVSALRVTPPPSRPASLGVRAMSRSRSRVFQETLSLPNVTSASISNSTARLSDL